MKAYFVQKQRHCKIIKNCTMIYKGLHQKSTYCRELARLFTSSVGKTKAFKLWQARAFQSSYPWGSGGGNTAIFFSRQLTTNSSSNALISKQNQRLMSERESPPNVQNRTGKHRRILQERPGKLIGGRSKSEWIMSLPSEQNSRQQYYSSNMEWELQRIFFLLSQNRKVFLCFSFASSVAVAQPRWTRVMTVVYSCCRLSISVSHKV